jgi:Flp pilus assembly secretin CpaC
VAPVLPQSSGGATPPGASSAQAAPSSPPPPEPDKGRARKAFDLGRRAEQARDWKAEFAAYTEAATYDPTNRQYAILKEHARFQVVQSLVDSAERQAVAGDLPGARALLTQALEIDPKYVVARERLSELTPSAEEITAAKAPRIAGLPRLILNPGTQAFDYRGTTRGAYEELGRKFGVKMVFDGDLPDRALRFQVPNLDFDTAVKVLSLQTKTFTRVVDTHTLFVTQDTPQKVRDYTLEVEKEIPLPASVTTDEMNEEVRMIREMTGISRTQLNTASRTLTVRSTEQNVALAQALVDQIEQPHGELMLEIDILELDRTLADQLGISPPTSGTVYMLTVPEIEELEAAQNIGSLYQILQTVFSSIAGSSASSTALPSLIAFGGGKSIFLSTMPSATASFSDTLSAVQSAQRVLLRAQDGKPASFFVGDRYPIDLGLLSSDLNGASSPLTSAVASALAAGLTLPRTDYAVGVNPDAVAIADVNGDGIPDLIVANHGDGTTANGTISILLGVSGGTFDTQTQFTVPGLTFPAGTASTTFSTPTAIAVDDFNGDGKPDIAVTDSANNDVVILFGDGAGNFAPSTTPSGNLLGGNPVAILAANFHSPPTSPDGVLDLAVVNQGNGTAPGSVSILLANKTNGVQNGTFSVPAAPNNQPVAVGKSPSAITSGIFVTAGFTDLAVTNQGDNTVSILLGQGTNNVQNGTFATQTTYPTGNGPAGIATADYNGDGILDLAVTNETDGTVSILLGSSNGNGTFLAQTAYTAGTSPVGIVAADFTGSYTDLAVTNDSSSSGDVDVLIGNGNGTFNTPISVPTGNSPVSLAAADLTGSGSIDLVTANNASNTVTVTLNTLASSSLGSSTTSQTAYPSAQYEDLGLKIKATPRLHDNREVTLQLQFDIKSLTGANINGIPILSNRNIEQTVRLRENETSIVSGLLQTNSIGSTAGLPWTSLAPGVGLLTGEDTTNIQKTELLILVTPRALRLPPHDFPAVYAGRGEPATPAASPPTGGPPRAQQPGPAGAPNPNQPPLGGRAPFPNAPQPGQAPGAVAQPPQQAPQQPQPDQQQQQPQQPPDQQQQQPQPPPQQQ